MKLATWGSPWAAIRSQADAVERKCNATLPRPKCAPAQTPLADPQRCVHVEHPHSILTFYRIWRYRIGDFASLDAEADVLAYERRTVRIGPSWHVESWGPPRRQSPHRPSHYRPLVHCRRRADQGDGARRGRRRRGPH